MGKQVLVEVAHGTLDSDHAPRIALAERRHLSGGGILHQNLVDA
jgi:hypothetical protein